MAEVEKRAIAGGTPPTSITKQQVAIELFAKSRLYRKQFYYCGMEPEGVKLQLRSLGIEREDPMEH